MDNVEKQWTTHDSYAQLWITLWKTVYNLCKSGGDCVKAVNAEKCESYGKEKEKCEKSLDIAMYGRYTGHNGNCLIR